MRSLLKVFIILVFAGTLSVACKTQSKKSKRDEAYTKAKIELQKEQQENAKRENSQKKSDNSDLKRQIDEMASDSASFEPTLGFVSPVFIRKVDKEADFIFGQDSLFNYLNLNFIVSEKAKDNGFTKGEISIEFTVDVTGKSANFKELIGVPNYPEVFDELARIMKPLKWNPAILNNAKVNSYKTLTFKIQPK